MSLVLYICAAVLLAAAALMVVSHLLGWSPARGSAPLRASAVEAGERTSDWAAEFWHWLRFGR
ncbi:MAG: hypothetical protein QOJ07_4 [Thermoleophilaceae bacterium]|jgi:hypothetical protein|nr:hypothetical protein [Thermoleophilaceae bacterium]